MLKTAKKIHKPTQLKIAQRELDRLVHHAETTKTEISSLFNIDPYPETGETTKIDLKLHQLEDFE